MVLQRTVYSTRGRSREAAPLYRSQKDFLEQHVLRRREAEVKRHTYWSQTASYWDRMSKLSDRYQGLTSEESRRNSCEALLKAREIETRKEGLLGRRCRLKKLLQEEQEAYQKELDSLPSGVLPISDLRAEKEKMRREKEIEMKKEADLKMLQHWKINNPKFRGVERSRNSFLVQKDLKEQIKEQKEREVKNKEMEEKEAIRMLEEDRRKVEDAERKEEERKEKLKRCKSELEFQMKELRTKEREMEVRRRERAEQEELQRKVEQCEEERKIVEKARENRVLETFQKRQHRLKLKKKAKEIQDDIEEDRKRLAEMEAITRLQDEQAVDKKAAAVTEVEWMEGVLAQQVEEEKRREKELEIMFAEEAAAMWSKQEEVWAREEKARHRLMEEVVSGWRTQQEERLEAARKVEEEVLASKLELEREVGRLAEFIQEQERDQLMAKEELVAGLDEGVREGASRRRKDWEEQMREEMAERQKEVREENKLARELAKCSLDQGTTIGDFRRRKVRWFY